MKQQMEIIAVTEFDNDKNIWTDALRKALQQAIQEAVKQVVGTPKTRTLVEVEFGDPV